MNQRIIFLKGLPGSGKTTYAKEFCTCHPEFVRINKDDIRILLGNFPYSREFEEEVLRIQREIGNIILKFGKSLIIDDTNFAKIHQCYWEYIAKSNPNGIRFTVMNFDTEVEECIQRDSEREKPVGKDVILKMYEKYVKPKNCG